MDRHTNEWREKTIVHNVYDATYSHTKFHVHEPSLKSFYVFEESSLSGQKEDGQTDGRTAV